MHMINKYGGMHPDELLEVHEELLHEVESIDEHLECIEEIMMNFPDHEFHRRGRRRSYHREGMDRGSYRRDSGYDREYDDGYHRQGVKGTGRYGIGGSRHYSHRYLR